MSSAKTKIRDQEEPIFAGTLNERFYNAVHESQVLHYDVVQVGYAAEKNKRRENGFSVNDGSTPYEMVILHSGNIDDTLLAKMMTLQNQTVKYAAAHPENFIDYKTEDEVIAHYSDDGLGLGIITAAGDLIGQAMLKFKLPSQGEISSKDSGAGIYWVMIDQSYKGNGLFESLINMATLMAEASGMSHISANVRTHNDKGLRKFSQLGFTVTGNGVNAKDGSASHRISKFLAPKPEKEYEHSLKPV